MRDPPGDVDSRPPGPVEAIQANTKEVEALRLVNQRLIEELEQLTRQMQHPRETRQTQGDHSIPPQEGRYDHSPPRGAEVEAESSQARGHGPQLALVEEENEAVHGRRVENEAVHGRRVENEEPHHAPPRTEEQTWEQRFRAFNRSSTA